MLHRAYIMALITFGAYSTLISGAAGFIPDNKDESAIEDFMDERSINPIQQKPVSIKRGLEQRKEPLLKNVDGPSIAQEIKQPPTK